MTDATWEKRKLSFVVRICVYSVCVCPPPPLCFCLCGFGWSGVTPVLVCLTPPVCCAVPAPFPARVSSCPFVVFLLFLFVSFPVSLFVSCSFSFFSCFPPPLVLCAFSMCYLLPCCSCVCFFVLLLLGDPVPQLPTCAHTQIRPPTQPSKKCTAPMPPNAHQMRILPSKHP